MLCYPATPRKSLARQSCSCPALLVGVWGFAPLRSNLLVAILFKLNSHPRYSVRLMICSCCTFLKLNSTFNTPQFINDRDVIPVFDRHSAPAFTCRVFIIAYQNKIAGSFYRLVIFAFGPPTLGIFDAFDFHAAPPSRKLPSAFCLLSRFVARWPAARQ